LILWLAGEHPLWATVCALPTSIWSVPVQSPAPRAEGEAVPALFEDRVTTPLLNPWRVAARIDRGIAAEARAIDIAVR